MGRLRAVGRGAVLAAFGSASVAAEDLGFTATPVPAGQAGLVFMGAASGVPFTFGDCLP